MIDAITSVRQNEMVGGGSVTNWSLTSCQPYMYVYMYVHRERREAGRQTSVPWLRFTAVSSSDSPVTVI